MPKLSGKSSRKRSQRLSGNGSSGGHGSTQEPISSQPPFAFRHKEIQNQRAQSRRIDINEYLKVKEIRLQIEEDAKRFDEKLKRKTREQFQHLNAQLSEFELVLQQYKATDTTSTAEPVGATKGVSPLISPVRQNGCSDDDNVKLCVVCLEQKKSHILIPCGHFAYCENCAKNIKICALCRKNVKSRVKVYES